MSDISKITSLVSKMFDDISPTYDLLNHFISAGQDIRWRKKAINELKKYNSGYNYVLDLAAGSGDLTVQLLKLSPKKLFSADLSSEMLCILRKKIQHANNILVQADACNLPFQDDFFDLVGISFGVRNFEFLSKSLKEINRVLKTGGKFLTIEMFKTPSKSFIMKSFSLYFNKFVPRIGNLISRNKFAYDYLFKSVASFMSAEEYQNLLMDNGFKILHSKNNFLGIVNSIIASKF